MFLAFTRRSKLIDRAHHSDIGAAARIPPEILFQIFVHLVHSPAFDQEPWLPEYPARSASRDGLRAAIDVCHAWRQSAEHAFYQTVEPQGIDACVKLARTLVTRSDLAQKVQWIEFPPETKLVHFDGPLTTTWLGLSAAVNTIVSVCSHVERFGVASGHTSFREAPGLTQLSQQLKCLSVDRVLHFLLPHVSRRVFVSHINDFLYFPDKPDGHSDLEWPAYPRLESLCLRDFRADISLSRTLLERQAHVVFPALKTLTLSRFNIPFETFTDLMLALEPTLRTLACYDLTVHVGPSVYSSGWHLLDVLPSMNLGQRGVLEDLRVHHANANLRLSGLQQMPRQSCSSLTGVTRMTLHPDLLDKFEQLPVQLRNLVVHYDRNRRTSRAMLTVIAVFARRLERWKISAPAFAKIEQRAPNCRLYELPRWRLVCFILREFARRQDVEIETNIWCVSHTRSSYND